MRWSHVLRGSVARRSVRRAPARVGRSSARVEALEYRRMLTAAPVAVYHFDEGDGNVVRDAAGGNDGTFAGESDPTRVPGNVGAGLALSFHGDGAYKGTGSRVDVAYSLNSVLGGTASLAAWIKTTQIGSETFWMSPSITGSEHLGDGNDVFWGNLGPDGTISLRRGDGPAAASTTAINDGQWHHVAFTRDAASGEQKVYVDGAFEAATVGVAGIAGSDFYAIGATTDVSFTGGFIEGYNYLDGNLDEVTIADRVWSADEVAALFTGATVPAPDGGPSDLEVAAAGPFSVTLGWQNHSTNEAGFEIERSTTGAEGTFVSVGGAPAGATSATDVTARPATHYFYRVRAVTLGGASDPSNVVEATTAEDPITRGPDGFGYAATFGAIADPVLSPETTASRRSSRATTSGTPLSTSGTTRSTSTAAPIPAPTPCTSTPTA